MYGSRPCCTSQVAVEHCSAAARRSAMPPMQEGRAPKVPVTKVDEAQALRRRTVAAITPMPANISA